MENSRGIVEGGYDVGGEAMRCFKSKGFQSPGGGGVASFGFVGRLSCAVGYLSTESELD